MSKHNKRLPIKPEFEIQDFDCMDAGDLVTWQPKSADDFDLQVGLHIGPIVEVEEIGRHLYYSHIVSELRLDITYGQKFRTSRTPTPLVPSITNPWYV